MDALSDPDELDYGLEDKEVTELLDAFKKYYTVTLKTPWQLNREPPQSLRWACMCVILLTICARITDYKW